ncbi:MAG: hypothetical protein ABH914_00980, partial [Candidatus Omnitrophota bacterium]
MNRKFFTICLYISSCAVFLISLFASSLIFAQYEDEGFSEGQGLKDVREELFLTKERLTALEELKAQQEEEINILNQALSQLRERLTDYQAGYSYNQIQQDKQSLESKNEELVVQIEELKKQQLILKKENQALSNALANSKEELAEINLTKVRQKFNQEKKVLLAKLKQYEEELSRGRQEIDGLKKEYETKKADCQNLSEQLSGSTDRYSILEKEKQTLLSQL